MIVTSYSAASFVRSLALGIAFFVTCVPLAAAAPTIVPIPDVPITTLLLHQISSTPLLGASGGEDQVKKPWISAAEFDAVLTDAENHGYHVISLGMALDFFARRIDASALPQKPLLLTFDDGYASAFTEGTPVLEKHHASATMFFEGILTDSKPGRLTTVQLEEMQSSGVWTLQSHGWMGHSNITLDAHGTKNPYWYANEMWLADKHRLETADEFEARIRADLHHFRDAFERKLRTKITLFAYPSGEFGQNSALLVGGDPSTRVEAGHSNAPGLTARLFSALRKEGFEAAFAVSIPGDAAPAERANDLLAIPRVGVGENFAFSTIDALQTSGTILPEIANDNYADPGPISIAGDVLYLASSVQPQIYRLNPDGRVLGSWRIDALMDDRRGRPSLISSIGATGDDLTIVQQAGWWANAHPRVTRVHLSGSTATVITRRALPDVLNWLVGTTPYHGKTIGMTDDGTLIDVERGEPLGQIKLVARNAVRQNRFAGPVVIGGKLYAFDRIAHALIATSETGVTGDTLPLAGDFRALAASGNQLIAVDYQKTRHLLQRFRVNPSS